MRVESREIIGMFYQDPSAVRKASGKRVRVAGVRDLSFGGRVNRGADCRANVYSVMRFAVVQNRGLRSAAETLGKHRAFDGPRKNALPGRRNGVRVNQFAQFVFNRSEERRVGKSVDFG